MKLLYFAWLKTKTGTAEEEVAPPPEVTTVAELMTWLRGRGPGYAEALADEAALRVAVNQEYARPGDRVAAGDEIALFPPVTGG
jgi:molybdopterin synthase sulfur carrier subunit